MSMRVATPDDVGVSALQLPSSLQDGALYFSRLRGIRDGDVYSDLLAALANCSQRNGI